MNDKKALVKMLYNLKLDKITPSDCGLGEFSKERAIKIIREEIQELD